MRARPLLLVLVLVILAGCDLTSAARHHPRPVDPGTVAADVRSVRVAADSVTITVSVPAGGRRCAARPHLVVSRYDATQVIADAVVDRDLAAQCDRRATRTFTAPLDLEGRVLRLGDVAYPAGGAGTPCRLRWATSGTQRDDLPPLARTHVVGCHDRWLVVDVGGGVRWFASLDPDDRWRVVATSTSGGCRDVRRAAPTFPRLFCRDLPTPGRV